MTTYNTNAPSTNDDIGTTLRKILAVVGGSGGNSSSLYTQTIPTSSNSPGVPGNYAISGGNLYLYDSTSNQWFSFAGSLF
jgi:hypothetical protein